MVSGAEVEGRDAWIGERCEDCPAGDNWLTAVYGRCRCLGEASDAEPPVAAWRCEGARLTSLLRVGGRELGFEENGENALEVYGRDREEEEVVLEDWVEEAGYEEVDEDEENDSDNRVNQRREVDGRGT